MFIRRVNNTLFDFDIEFLREDLRSANVVSDGYAFDQRHVRFMKFYRTEKASLIKPANRSMRINTFERLLKEYLDSKHIDIYPSGLVLHDSLNKNEIINKSFSTEPYGKMIDLNTLSSGEKKIVLLLALACFTDDLTLLLDEPELSLSLIWQEKLLPDMLNHTNVKQVIVATHSPYIATDESLTPFLTYLPTNTEVRHDA